ncbi:PREDICTED: uncharacterized protein LOC108756368 [Trachymyrmex septentrionalis]|uniref:uncharacterized protein LOC108756368 n=1 Tax=Trachymyrmex septentrionalis TaxID=34720 RepID=UPI00084F4980|nr:PREDICTED: uncharacterized protein LOC108756368 [Trachymyrmex septentrionalis]
MGPVTHWNKLWQAQQHWIAGGILIEAYTAAAKMARIGYVDQHKNDLSHITSYERFLYVEGKLTKNKVVQGTKVVLGNNCIAFIFDEIRYELIGVEIDHNRNKRDSADQWDEQTAAVGYFNFCVSLYALLGFCEDYNALHELILIQARNNNNCLTGDPATEPTIELFNMQGDCYTLLSEINKLLMLRILESGRYLSMVFARGMCTSFRSCRAQSSIREPSRWLLNSRSCAVIFAMQTGRRNIMSENISRFEDSKLTNAKLYLNSECYPYDDLNLDFDKNRCGILYDLYARFCLRI